jgi:hypothetical protein
MGREYRILSKLHGAHPLAPEPVAFCEDEAVIGANFLRDAPPPGIILRKELPAGLSLPADTLRTLHLNLVDNLARIHAIDYAKAGPGDLGKPQGYVERQVTGWTKRYAIRRRTTSRGDGGRKGSSITSPKRGARRSSTTTTSSTTSCSTRTTSRRSSACSIGKCRPSVIR